MKEQENRKEQQEQPDSYGTGRRPEQEKRHSLTMSMLWVLVGVSMAFNLFLLKKLAGREAELSHDRQTAQWSYLPQPEGEQSDQEGLRQSVESGLVQIVPDGEEALGCTGVILSEDGYILTNASLLDGRRELIVILPDGSGCEARMIGMDGDSDLAVLKTEAANLSPVQIAETDCIGTGDGLILFSFTLGQDFFEQTLSEDGKRDICGVERRVLRVDCGKGSLLLNEEGQLVAFGKGEGEALPMSDIMSLAGELILYGCIGAPDSMGIEVAELDQAQRSYWDLPGGVVINHVLARGNAQKAGLQTGDILLRIGDEPITDAEAYWQAVGSCREGETVVVEVYRSGERIELEIKLNQK